MILNFNERVNKQAATTKGPNKRINQDAFGIAEYSGYLLMVVADGLGSAETSEIGSQVAVKAVKKAVAEWRKLKNEKNEILIQLIHFYWNLYINDLDCDKQKCSTTCLFSYINKCDNKIIIGQLGDGLILYESGKNKYITPKSDDFNYTKSLGTSKKLNDWNLYSSDIDLSSFKCFLATDGISEDIAFDKEEEFVDYLIVEMEKLRMRQRNFFIRKTLINWPTKYHTDDKTMSIAWSNKWEK